MSLYSGWTSFGSRAKQVVCCVKTRDLRRYQRYRTHAPVAAKSFAVTSRISTATF